MDTKAGPILVDARIMDGQPVIDAAAANAAEVVAGETFLAAE